jgi:hypothetical protein
MPKKLKKTSHRRRTLLITSAIVAVIVGVCVLAWATNRSTKPAKTIKTISSSNPEATSPISEPSTSSTQTTNVTTTSPSPPVSVKNPVASASPSSGALVEPTGPFVSNHNYDGSSQENAENSVCNTTPGATCVIEFTQGNTTWQLAPEVANSDGAAYWQWNVSSSGLTQGSWTITATATLNGSSITATDSNLMEISE